MKLPSTLTLPLCGVLLSISGCQSTSVQDPTPKTTSIADEFYNYQNAKEAGDKNKALKALENMFAMSQDDDEYLKISGDLLAAALLSGSLGTFDQQRFIEVAQSVGDKLNPSLKYELQQIDKYYAYKAVAPGALKTLHQKSAQYCTDASAVSNLAITADNEAIHYLNSADCVNDFLLKDPKARQLIAQHFEHIGVRENAKIKALGFSLFETPASAYATLTKSEQAALLSAKEQAYSYKVDDKAPDFKMSTKSGELESMENLDKMFAVFDLAENNLADNIEAINKDVEMLMTNGVLKEKSKSFLLYQICMFALGNNNLAIFDDYLARLGQGDYLTVRNKMYMNKLRLMILHDTEDYLVGLDFVDNLLKG